MLFSRSYTILRLARSTGEKFIFRNISRNSRISFCADKNVSTEKIGDENCKGRLLPESITDCSIGYADKSKNIVSANNQLDNGIVKTCNEPVRMQDITFVERNVHKYNDALEDLQEKAPGPLDPCNEDLSHIGPYATPTFNFAKYADKSSTLQQLINLGVQLYKLERDREVVETYLKLDFNKDMKPYIRFLHDCGVPAYKLGSFITKNPKIFMENMDDLYTRIRYLKAHKFTSEMIRIIITKCPMWLSHKTEDIDRRLGHFQNTFKLNGYEVRLLALKRPKLILYRMTHIKKNTFAVKEEMGFNANETKKILINTPNVWISARTRVTNSFDYAHNVMKLSHITISEQSNILLCRKTRLKQRHEFLVQLKKDQYDPLKPMYVSPMALITGTDLEFCKNVAKAYIDTYNMFLKSC